ncbi:unnamed protein product, partial [Meganyctiphanes norvegica]
MFTYCSLSISSLLVPLSSMQFLFLVLLLQVENTLSQDTYNKTIKINIGLRPGQYTPPTSDDIEVNIQLPNKKQNIDIQGNEGEPEDEEDIPFGEWAQDISLTDSLLASIEEEELLTDSSNSSKYGSSGDDDKNHKQNQSAFLGKHPAEFLEVTTFKMEEVIGEKQNVKQQENEKENLEEEENEKKDQKEDEKGEEDEEEGETEEVEDEEDTYFGHYIIYNQQSRNKKGRLEKLLDIDSKYVSRLLRKLMKSKKYSYYPSFNNRENTHFGDLKGHVQLQINSNSHSLTPDQKDIDDYDNILIDSKKTMT